MAFLHPAAFPRSRLDWLGSVHLGDSFHPLNAHCGHSALLPTGCRALATPKPVPWTRDAFLCTAWLGPKARAASWNSAVVKEQIGLIVGCALTWEQEASLVLDREPRQGSWGLFPLCHGRFVCFPVDPLQSVHPTALMGCCSHCWPFVALFLSPRP